MRRLKGQRKREREEDVEIKQGQGREPDLDSERVPGEGRHREGAIPRGLGKETASDDDVGQHDSNEMKKKKKKHVRVRNPDGEKEEAREGHKGRSQARSQRTL